MSTATLSKKERKQLRKQMVERKQQLQAKHGRSGGKSGVTSGGVSGGGGGGGADSRLGSSRMFSDIKPKLPSDPPKSKLPTWTPPTPHRALPNAEKPKAKAFRRRSLRPRVADTASGVVMPHPAIEVFSGVRDLDDTGPGPLTRAAATLEHVGRRTLHAWRNRPWRDLGDARRSETYRSLTLLIKPLRLLGVVAIAGAIVLGRESRGMGASDTGSLVVLGMGLGLAVVLLALAEIAHGLRTIARRI